MSARERLTDALYGAGWGTVKKLPEPVAVRLGRTVADEVASSGRRPHARGPALLAQHTGARLLPVTLWYDESPVMQGRVHPPVEVPESGTRAEKTSVMTQALADAFATGIAEHPEDWHMLQRRGPRTSIRARPRARPRAGPGGRA
ncbi:hypothetical protein SALBM217S_04332 [Streptomyces griseoloalbus]